MQATYPNQGFQIRECINTPNLVSTVDPQDVSWGTGCLGARGDCWWEEVKSGEGAGGAGGRAGVPDKVGGQQAADRLVGSSMIEACQQHGKHMPTATMPYSCL